MIDTIDKEYEAVLDKYKSQINLWIDSRQDSEELQHLRPEELKSIKEVRRGEISIEYTAKDGNCYEFWMTERMAGISSICKEEEE